MMGPLTIRAVPLIFFTAACVSVAKSAAAMLFAVFAMGSKSSCPADPIPVSQPCFNQSLEISQKSIDRIEMPSFSTIAMPQPPPTLKAVCR